jgi:hypothetical protein
VLTVLHEVFTFRRRLQSLECDKPSGSSTVVSDAPRLLLFPLEDSEGARSTPAVLLPLESVCRRVTRLTFGFSSSMSSSMASLDVSALGSFVSAVMDDPDSYEGRVSTVDVDWLIQHTQRTPSSHLIWYLDQELRRPSWECPRMQWVDRCLWKGIAG